MIKGDIIVIAATVILAVILLIVPIVSNDNDAIIKIINNGAEYYYDLQNDDIIEIFSNGYQLKVVIENGTVYVSESECPDGICLAMNKISKRGQFIACVPAGVYIEAVAKSGDLYDNTIAG